jgi:hypothetical protein
MFYFSNKYKRLFLSKIGSMVRFFLRSLIFTVLIVSLSSCTKIKQFGKPSEGVITYDVSLLRSELGSMANSAIPTQVKVYFDDPCTLFELEGVWGNLKISQYADPEAKLYRTMIFYFGENVYCESDKPLLLQPFFEQATVNEVDGDSTIVGCKSKKAEACYVSDNKKFDVWYSDEVRLSHPNSSNVFHSISGVLMVFELHSPTLDIKLNIKKLEAKAVSKEVFDIPKNCRKVSVATVNRVLCELFLVR